MNLLPWIYRLLVGAPAADSEQPDVIKGGGVFKCPPENPGQCELIPFDTKGMKASEKYSICKNIFF